jgi:diguanylate cyclase (GGDEF)-like protein/PAS domain S-box-containing protein
MRQVLRRFDWLLIAVAAFAAAYLLRASGQLTGLENRIVDWRSSLLHRPVASDIVIVGIDERSLAALSQWPWPRERHAQLLKFLNRAGARQVFVDIDFSSPTNPHDDALLTDALAHWQGERPILPVYLQQASGDKAGVVATRPLPQLVRYARLASVNVMPGADGLVRALPAAWRIDGSETPSVVSAVTGATLPPNVQPMPIDFSIDPSSFAYFSYSDVLRNHVSVAEFSGKTVFVGATAVELGDMLPVPRYRALPGVELLALAAATAEHGVPRVPPSWLYLATLATLALAAAAALRHHGWRRNLSVLALACALAALLDGVLFRAFRYELELAPLLALGLAVFLLTTLRALDEQTLHALLYRLGLERREALLKSIVESCADCILCIDAHGIVQTANPAALRLFAASAPVLRGAPVALFIPMLAECLQNLASSTDSASLTQASEFDARDIDGAVFPVEIALSRVWAKDEPLYTAIVRDIRERRAQERALEHRATHDELTALPNRAGLNARLETLLAETMPERSLALMMLDLCRFKEVNDTLGHEVGDRVLREAARRFEAVVGDAGFVARLGGDEFVVLIEQLPAARGAAELATRLCDCLRTPIHVDSIPIDIGVDIGIAVFPHDAHTPVMLLRHADVAMYEAKRRGSGHEYYDPKYNEYSVRRLTMVGELRKAIADGTIGLCYQPLINLCTGRVDCVEALLRWRHAAFGDVSPAEFVGMAETTDLIWPLTEWTLGEALSRLRCWHEAGLSLRVAVNLSARMLQDGTYPGRLRALLARFGTDPASLELEITESAMMSDPRRALEVLSAIHALGVQISVDDFGTGFSSLAYLRDLPVHALKLDKSFIIDMRSREDNRVIARSTAQMAHALGLRIVAEGVETSWHAQELTAAGYDYAQGYYYSAALPADACERWIRTRHALEPELAAAVA